MSRKKYASTEDNYKSALGGRIRAARGEKPQEWLADALRVSTSRVSEWEGGKKEPRASTLTRIAAATGCDLAWLLAGNERASRAPGDVSPIYSKPPEGVSPEAWHALLPLLPMLAAIWDAKKVPRHKDRWAWIEGNIKSFFELVEPDVRPMRAERKKAG